MTEPVTESRPSEVTVLPVEPDRELAHRNNVLGIALLGLSLLIVGGTFLVAFIYLAVD